MATLSPDITIIISIDPEDRKRLDTLSRKRKSKRKSLRNKIKDLKTDLTWLRSQQIMQSESIHNDNAKIAFDRKHLRFLASDYALDCSISVTIDPPKPINFNELIEYYLVKDKNMLTTNAADDATLATPDNPFLLSNTQFTTIRITGALDRRGNSIPIDTVTVTSWAVDGSIPLSLDPSADNLACVVTPLAGFVGPATIIVAADADPGVGIISITRSFTFDIANEVLVATSLTATIDEPQDVAHE